MAYFLAISIEQDWSVIDLLYGKGTLCGAAAGNPASGQTSAILLTRVAPIRAQDSICLSSNGTSDIINFLLERFRVGHVDMAVSNRKNCFIRKE